MTRKWRLARRIAELFGRPVADSHVRALVDVASQYGAELPAVAYVHLRRHGAETGRRVTAEVVENLGA
ncbi:hypothetical protein ACFY9C_34975 [Streptomyces filamentosus]|uniref:hypothetical protein n=1 Tax=Streptomyces filamentosus TaxID=67294 RepID=UPI0036EAFBE9